MEVLAHENKVLVEWRAKVVGSAGQARSEPAAAAHTSALPSVKARAAAQPVAAARGQQHEEQGAVSHAGRLQLHALTEMADSVLQFGSP